MPACSGLFTKGFMDDANVSVRLNIGGGNLEIPGFVTVDRKNGQEAYPLAYEDESVDEIYASHVLEHFGFADVGLAIRDWIRTLKPGGLISIAVPDFGWIAKQYTGRGVPEGLLMAYTMGGQTNADDYHHALFDHNSLSTLMRKCGLERIRPFSAKYQDCARLPVSLNLQGQKKGKKQAVQLPRITAAMSTSRLGFTENLFCAMKVLKDLNIDLTKFTGAYWGPGLERCLLESIDHGAEWVVTLDYDTVFTTETLEELCWLMATNPHADAIAPIQSKRECDQALMFIKDTERLAVATLDECDLYPVDTAHFGLTLIRVEALKRMSHPWFYGQPNEEGTWGDGRVDEDIAFWHKWKETGNTLFIATHVSIGHLQQVATWPDHNLRPIHQFVTEFQLNGQPKEARC